MPKQTSSRGRRTTASRPGSGRVTASSRRRPGRTRASPPTEAESNASSSSAAGQDGLPLSSMTLEQVLDEVGLRVRREMQEYAQTSIRDNGVQATTSQPRDTSAPGECS